MSTVDGIRVWRSQIAHVPLSLNEFIVASADGFPRSWKLQASMWVLLEIEEDAAMASLLSNLAWFDKLAIWGSSIVITDILSFGIVSGFVG